MKKLFCYLLVSSLLSVVNISQISFAEDFRLPVIVGQTGASSTFGKVELDGYTLAVEDWNTLNGGIDGKSVKLQSEDTQTNQKYVISAFYKLDAEKHKVILGPTWLDGLQGVIPIAKRRDVLLVSPSAEFKSFSENNRGPVTFYYNSQHEAEVLVDGMSNKGFKRVAVLYEQEPFAELFKNLIKSASTKKFEISDEVGTQAGETYFKSTLLRVKEKKPDALVVLVWDERSLLTLLKEIKVFLPDIKLVTIHDGEGWLTKPDFKREISQLMYPRFEIHSKSFVEKFKKRFGYEVNLTGSNAYDAAWSVLEAMKAGNRDAQKVRNYLTSQLLNTVTFGPIKLNPEGFVEESNVTIKEYIG